MKKLLLIFIFPFLTSFVDGGGDDWTNFFRYYEPGLNLLYVSVNSDLTIQTEKKAAIMEVTNNIAVYDIAHDSTQYIFQKDFKEEVSGILFEESYDAKTSSIKLNIHQDEDSEGLCINNADVTQRELSSKLIIETTAVPSGRSSLWLCNKNGSRLEKVDELKDNESYYLDIKGRNILIIKTLDSKIEVKKVKY